MSDADRICVVGKGKVGRTFARELKRAGFTVTARAGRRGPPGRELAAGTVLFAVRDGALRDAAHEWAEADVVARDAVVLHVAGALGPEALEPLRARCAGAAQLHPMLSFASADRPPELRGGFALVTGDAPARRRAALLARKLGMTARSPAGVNRPRYHAAGAVVANGASAVASVGVELLRAAGIPEADIPHVLGPLLVSVGRNIATLGLPDALTGPIRRGDADTVRRHLDDWPSSARPPARSLYLASARVQVALARQLGEASPAALKAIEQLLSEAERDGATR